MPNIEVCLRTIFMNKKIVVTGSSGFIGRWVVEQLKKDGHRVIGLDKVKPAVSINLDENIECNILDRDLLIAEIRRSAPDSLIHLAARIDLNEKKHIRGYADNIEGVRNVIEAVRQTPSIRRALYTSSQLVCAVGYIPKSDTDYCPDTLYGKSKVLTETLVREEDGGGVEWCLVRPTTVWGPYMNRHYQNMLKYIQKGRYFHVGQGRLFKSYGYAGNTAYQYAQLLKAEREQIHRKTLYMADYHPLSLRDYTDTLACELGAPKIPSMPLSAARLLAHAGNVLNKCGLERFPFNTFRLNNILTEYVFDMAEMEKVCGLLPYTQEQGIAQTAQWYLNEQRQANNVP
jgi:GlcNAc-P-P-Und epimerase